MLAPWKKIYDKPRQHIRKQRYYFAYKGPSSQTSGFSSSHVCMWELDHKGSWMPKNWCFWAVVLEKTLESPLNSKKIQPVHPKGNHSWIFIGRTDAETPILWPPDEKNWLTWEEKTLVLGKIEGRRRRGWHPRLYGHVFVQAPRFRDGWGNLSFFSPQGCKESDRTEWLNWTEKAINLNISC